MESAVERESRGWIEDSVVFRGTIRKSGNSLVITIPSELSQRFLLKEGQEFVILGMGRFRPDFEGALQVYLGYFVVYEKTFGFRVVLSASGERLETALRVFDELAEKYRPTKHFKRTLEDGRVEVKMFFGMMTGDGFRRLRTKEEVESILAEALNELSNTGVQAEDPQVLEEINEWRNVDPSSISKLPHKLGELVRWKWEI